MKVKTILLLILIIVAVIIFLKTIDKCKKKCLISNENATNTESDEDDEVEGLENSEDDEVEGLENSEDEDTDSKEEFIIDDIMGTMETNQQMEKTKTMYNQPKTQTATSTENANAENKSVLDSAIAKLQEGANSVKNYFGLNDSTQQKKAPSTFTQYTGNPNMNIKNKSITSNNFKTYEPPRASDLAYGGCSCNKRGNAYTTTENDHDYESASAVTKHVDSRILVPKPGDIQGFNSYSVEYPVSQGTY